MGGDAIHRFEVGAVWSGDGSGSGEVRVSDGGFPVPIAGATSLGGSGGKANPEELYLAAIAACFVNTWAIFLAKLKLGYAEPSVRVSGELAPDPAGGYRMRSAVVHARVPASLRAESREAVDKTLALAEKYCIISKAARAAISVRVEVEEV